MHTTDSDAHSDWSVQPDKEHDNGSSIERPDGAPAKLAYGSDIVATTLRELGIDYIALNPGASYRGLHDSLVNHLGNHSPQMLVCLHEEHAVAIAHGYAKVTGRAMGAAVHSNVGLFHATMAIFNAWCDRMPVLVLGATGPVDAQKRRPWIDWIHTARDQGAIVRPYVKWDDQPASAGAARESLARAKWLAETLPSAPVYVNLDAGMQEAKLEETPQLSDLPRIMPSVTYRGGAADAERVVAKLNRASRPIILVGRVSRSTRAWANRIALAESTNARVLSDLKVGAGFPTDHSLSLADPAIFPSADAVEAIMAADFVLSLDWPVLAGLFSAENEPAAEIVHVSLDHHLHNGWSMDHQGLAPIDEFVAADTDEFVDAMVAASELEVSEPVHKRNRTPDPGQTTEADEVPLNVSDIAQALGAAVGDRPCSLLHLPLSWDASYWTFAHPLDFIGSDGGAGIGAGPGISVGAALALRDTERDRLPISVCGDGDFVMGVTAIWTAVHYRIPMLVVVANNQSYYNDEVHQEKVARFRDRPVENKWIGQKLAEPDIDIAALAKAQGAKTFGPVVDRESLYDSCRQAVQQLDAGQVVVIDARIEPGYTPSMAKSL